MAFSLSVTVTRCFSSPLICSQLEEHGFGILCRNVPEHVGVAVNELCADVVGHAADVESARLILQLRVENDLQEHVAEFLSEQFRVLGINRFDDFVGFLDKIVSDTLVGLFDVPRATAGARRIPTIVQRS